MKEEDLYARYQSLAALVSVLLHDLRNPLHSATLLVEAMGMRTADVESLRGKLRSQFAKLDGLISEANGSIRELSLEPRVGRVKADQLIAEAVDRLRATHPEAQAQLPPASDITIASDATLLACAMAELAANVVDQSVPKGRVAFTVEHLEGDVVRFGLGNFTMADPAAARAPFSIAGGGVRLALARGLAQQSGASLRLEALPDGCSRYTLTIKPPT